MNSWNQALCGPSLLAMLLTPLLAMFAGGAIAQPELPRPDVDDFNFDLPAAQRPWTVGIGLTSSYSDNFFYTPARVTDQTTGVTTRNNGSDSIGFLANPYIIHRRATPTLNLMLRAGLTAGDYSTSSADAFVDGHLGLFASQTLAREQHLRGRLGYNKGHDPFGQERTEGQSSFDADLDEFQMMSGSLTYGLGGTQTQRGGIEFTVTAADKDYTTNEARTTVLEYQQRGAGVNIVYALSPKTTFRAGVRSLNTEYEANGTNSRDGDATTAFFGARWQATGKSTGDIEIGGSRREFDDTAREELEIGYWKINVRYDASAKTRYTVTTSRQFEPSYRTDAGTIDRLSAALNWRQEWNARVFTTAGLSTRSSDFHNTTQEDDISRLHGKINILLDESFKIFVGAAYQDKQSTNDNLEWDRTSFEVGMKADLN